LSKDPEEKAIQRPSRQLSDQSFERPFGSGEMKLEGKSRRLRVRRRKQDLERRKRPCRILRER
jgi:hypothetical protein